MTRKSTDWPRIASSEITPESVWLNRRNLMKAAAAGSLAAALPERLLAASPAPQPLEFTRAGCDACQATDTLTPYEDATEY
ncbi:MAG: twin-arginine translocation signal domain-containing protein, partial [Luminiphilus sp.]|nr:twin-arginine translocation signal domain-containing protein [Luminiphilus sp.]